MALRRDFQLALHTTVFPARDLDAGGPAQGPAPRNSGRVRFDEVVTWGFTAGRSRRVIGSRALGGSFCQPGICWHLREPGRAPGPLYLQGGQIVSPRPPSTTRVWPVV